MRVVDLDGNTRLAAKTVAGALGFLVTTGAAFVFWLTTMHSDIASAKAELRVLRADLLDNASGDVKRQFDYINVLHRIDTRLARMEERMGIQPAKEN